MLYNTLKSTTFLHKKNTNTTHTVQPLIAAFVCRELKGYTKTCESLLTGSLHS